MILSPELFKRSDKSSSEKYKVIVLICNSFHDNQMEKSIEKSLPSAPQPK